MRCSQVWTPRSGLKKSCIFRIKILYSIPIWCGKNTLLRTKKIPHCKHAKHFSLTHGIKHVGNTMKHVKVAALLLDLFMFMIPCLRLLVGCPNTTPASAVRCCLASGPCGLMKYSGVLPVGSEHTPGGNFAQGTAYSISCSLNILFWHTLPSLMF